MKNKRSTYIWIVLTLIVLGIISYIFAAVLGVMSINIFLKHHILTISAAAVLSLIFNLINIYILVVYFYKLYNLKDDVIKWNNLFFYFFIFSSCLGLFFNYLMFLPVVVIPWVILMVIVALIWITFLNHLKRIKKTQLENILAVSDNNNTENKEIIKEKRGFVSWIKNNKTILIIIFVILVLIFGPSLFMVTKSKIECGENAKLVDDKNGGYYCSYYFINEPENNKCIDAEQFCGLKGKIDKSNACGFDSVYGVNMISVKKDGVTYLKDGPVACNYCCSNDSNNEIKDNLKPSPIVDTVNMVNERGEKVDKFVKSFFYSDFGDFEYKERYDPNPGDLRDHNGNAVNDCITKNCSTVYFKKVENNDQKMVALFNDKDKPIIGKVIDLRLYSGDKLVSSLNLQKNDNYLIYTISNLYYDSNMDSASGQIEYKEDLCVEYKGGGFNCHEPSFKKNDRIFLFENTGPDSLMGHFLVSDIIRAKLIKYQYYMIPDTGEVFPVITR